MMPKRRILVVSEENDTGSDIKRQKKIAVSLLKSHIPVTHLNLTGLSGQLRHQ